MQAIKPRQQCMRIVLDMLMVLFQNRSQKFVLRFANGLDDETIIS